MSKTGPSIARYIEAAVWKSQGDITDVISIGKLVRKSDGPLEIEQIMNTMAKYDNMVVQQDRPRSKEERYFSHKLFSISRIRRIDGSQQLADNLYSESQY